MSNNNSNSESGSDELCEFCQIKIRETIGNTKECELCAIVCCQSCFEIAELSPWSDVKWEPFDCNIEKLCEYYEDYIEHESEICGLCRHDITKKLKEFSHKLIKLGMNYDCR